MSALDELIEQETARMGGSLLPHLDGRRSRLARLVAATNEKNELRAELSALRQRCEDAELIARAAIDPSGGVVPLDEPAKSWHLRAGMRVFVLPDNGNGFPALTDTARKALGGKR